MWQMKDFKERNNFILRTSLLEMCPSHAKMRLKSAPQKLNFVMAKAITFLLQVLQKTRENEC